MIPRTSPAWQRQRAAIDARLADEDAARAFWDSPEGDRRREEMRAIDAADAAAASPPVTSYEALAGDPMAVYRRRELLIGTQGDESRQYRIDSSRFGRRFVRSGLLVHDTRAAANVTLEQIALALGVSKGLLSRWETGDLGLRKLRIGAPLVAAVALVLRVSPGEVYIALVAETHLEMRAIYYPDDPGIVGAALGLPLPGAEARIAARDALP